MKKLMMAVADVVCVFACIFGMTASAAVFNGVEYSDSGDIVPEEVLKGASQGAVLRDRRGTLEHCLDRPKAGRILV